MIEEAPLRRAEAGLVPDGDGWFIVGVADAEGAHSERFGDGCVFEGRMGRFPEFGINVRVLEPGQPGSLYHREDAQEAFLVLSGECLAIVEDQERAMRKGDLLYTPPNTAHALVGAGERPCAILMVGSRKPSKSIVYPVSEVAARYGASVDQETDDPRAAYAGIARPGPATIGLPW